MKEDKNLAEICRVFPFLRGRVTHMTLIGNSICHECSKPLSKGDLVTVVIIGQKKEDWGYFFFCSDNCRTNYEAELRNISHKLARKF